MFAYISEMYLHVGRGWSYILSNLVLACGIVFVLDAGRPMRKHLGGLAAKCLVCFLLNVCLCGLIHMVISTGAWGDRLGQILTIVFCAAFFSNYSLHNRVARGVVYFTSTQLALIVSEPFGDFLRERSGTEHLFFNYSTLIIILAISVISVVLLVRFSYDRESVVMPQFEAVLVLMPIGILSLMYLFQDTTSLVGRLYGAGMAAFLWVLEMGIYFLFYSVSRVSDENMELRALKQKAEMEK
ncbi:MAG: hypothetical protein LUF30_05260, partial [Lachnospiraceae bacterium]|nr:hypothetical protein [Lachnospiraceae bacterium]